MVIGCQKSGYYGGCKRISWPSSFSLCSVAVATSWLALSWRRIGSFLLINAGIEKE